MYEVLWEEQVSRWTHVVCPKCYSDLEPGREPSWLVADAGRTEICCRCGQETYEGIYYRADPVKMQCGGKHEDEE